MRITKLYPRKKLGGFDVYIDNRLTFTLSDEVVVKDKIRVGLDLTEEAYEVLRQKSNFFIWYNKLLNFLLFRPRSESEIKKKIKEIAFKAKDQPEDIKKELSGSLIKKLKEQKLVNDRDFAQWFVDQRMNSRKKSGVNKVKYELFAKGVPQEVVNSVLKDFQDKNEETTESRMEDAVKSKLKTYLKEDKNDFKRKLSSFLIRRGFEPGAVFPFVDTLAKTKYNTSRSDNLE